MGAGASAQSITESVDKATVEDLRKALKDMPQDVKDRLAAALKEAGELQTGNVSSESREPDRQHDSNAFRTADIFVKAWAQKAWICEADMYPEPPHDVSAMYEAHLAIQSHPLVESAFGGHGGYKIGAVGALGEVCIYAPLFHRCFARAPDGTLSVSSMQMHQVEPEFGIILGRDLDARSDGAPHSDKDVWMAAESVVMCIECCGRRSTAEVLEQQPVLGKFADILMAGGVVLGSQLEASKFDAASLSNCKTSLAINGNLVAEGSGAACPNGGPVEALTWLANHLNSRGLSLKAGQLVITGATCISRDFKVGDKLSCEFAGLGSVETILQP